jgi:2-oxoglutarate ferredoxin oxidoreductase subunit gamma
MLKSHGTEMRGGYVRSQVVLAKEVVDSPMCECPDFLVALSSAAYNRFKHTVPDDGLIIYDPDFVEEVDDKLTCAQQPLRAKKLAMDNFGKPLFSNSVVLGALAKLLEKEGVVNKETLLESLLAIIPKFKEENKQAFELGYNSV